jgi:ferredoxin-thioredoxin reductase catalytic subunit
MTPKNKEIDELYKKLKKEGEKRGYLLNSDEEFTKLLIKSLLINNARYGYLACPCRLASGDRKEDLDIICPCDYRDIDLDEFGCCYCSLYVSEKNFKNKTSSPIPERRNEVLEEKKKEEIMAEKKLPVWRCKVCGYLCAREHAPEKCPICGVDSDRFELFEFKQENI